MITDKELFIQMLERDVVALYSDISKSQPLLSIPIVQQSIFGYADKGIEYITNLLFGKDIDNTDIEEATDMAKFIANDKIEEYRNKLREQKNNSNN